MTQQQRWARLLVLAAKTLLPILVLGAGAATVTWMMQTASQAERTERTRQARLVEVVTAQAGSQRIDVQAQGTVRPARETVVRPQVTGELIEVNDSLEPGERLARDELMVRIEPRDFELAVQMAQSDLDEAKAELLVEQGNQAVAEREYELLDQDLSEQERALVLRQPQLATARARVSRAEAALGDAELDLERTRITAPFDALVVEESVDIGTRLTSTQSEIATLIGTDRFWVELSVPQSDLAWIELPTGDAPGARTVLRQPRAWGEDVTRQGRVLRLLSDVSERGRMARLLVAVDDPLALEPDNHGKPRLIVGQYLQAEIKGKTITDAIALDRELLRQGDRVWVMNDDNRLEIRPVEIAHRGRSQVIITAGLGEGERVVATDIAAAAEGMALRLEEQSDPDAGSGAVSAADGGGPRS